MSPIPLTPWDLALAAVLVLLLAAAGAASGLGRTSRDLAVAAVRMTVQLALIGLVLKALFSYVSLPLVILMATVMLLVAGREAAARQRRRLAGPWGYGVGTVAIGVSSFAVTVLALTVILSPEPWYEPRYAVPLMGLLLGNAMSGTALGLNHLLSTCHDRREEIEQRLMLGETARVALEDLRREAMHAGLIPIVNAMSAAGVVSLPGVMTGQILAGVPPLEAVRYQLLIMFLFAAASGFGQLLAVTAAGRRMFDERHRLRLERLT